MNDIPAVIGDLAQGGLLARAAEPTHGEGHSRETTCLNCGTPLLGPHCHNCGQQGHVHRTLGAFFHDFLHGVLHFEGKIWRTLPLLVWHPGRLTREYIDGRRASYVSPIALFLFVVFLTFAGFHALGQPIKLNGTVTSNGHKMTLEQAEPVFAAKVEDLQRRRAAALAAGQPVVDIDQELAGDRSELATIRALRSDSLSDAMAKLPAQNATATKSASWIDATWRKAKANPDLLIFKLESDAYKYSWLLIPISVPFVWLLFPLRRRRLYDHTVFVTYSLSFMTLVLLVASAGAKWGIKPLLMIPVLYVPVHMYRQIRGTYGTGVAGTLARTGLLLIFAAVALTLWALAIVGLILGG